MLEALHSLRHVAGIGRDDVLWLLTTVALIAPLVGLPLLDHLLRRR